MRLWHYDLISYLPRQQLVSQLRECVAIAKSIYENGTPNHILVNKIINYSILDFEAYIRRVLKEMYNRKYHVSDITIHKINGYLGIEIPIGRLSYSCSRFIPFEKWHNDVYLRECLYNLEEKYLCGGISNNEWKAIYSEFNDFTPLVKFTKE